MEGYDVLLVLSNLFMFFPIRWTYKKQYYTECLTFTLTTGTSMIYHSGIGNENIYNALQFLDFYCASMTLITVNIHLLHYKTALAKTIHFNIMSYLAIGFIYYYQFNNFLIYQGILIGTAFFTIICRQVKRRKLPEWNARNLCLVFPTLSGGIIFFYWGNPYWLFHSLWHIFIMLSIYIALKIPLFQEPTRDIDTQSEELILVTVDDNNRPRHRRQSTWG